MGSSSRPRVSVSARFAALVDRTCNDRDGRLGQSIFDQLSAIWVDPDRVEFLKLEFDGADRVGMVEAKFS